MESVTEKRMFQNGIHYHRTVIPAAGFYEWSRLKEKNIDLIYEEDLNKFLINKNKNLEFGARPLRGIINRK